MFRRGDAATELLVFNRVRRSARQRWGLLYLSAPVSHADRRRSARRPKGIAPDGRIAPDSGRIGEGRGRVKGGLGPSRTQATLKRNFRSLLFVQADNSFNHSIGPENVTVDTILSSLMDYIHENMKKWRAVKILPLLAIIVLGWGLAYLEWTIPMGH